MGFIKNIIAFKTNRAKGKVSLEDEILKELEWLKSLLDVAEDTVTRRNIHSRAQLLLFKLEELATDIAA